MECLEGITPVNVEVLLEIQFLQIHVLLFQDKRDINFAKTSVLHVAAEN